MGKQGKDNNEDLQISQRPGAPWWRLLFLLVSPKTGWRRLKGAGYLPEYFARALFYPLLAVLAVSHFMLLIYAPETTITKILQEAVAAFVAGFAGFFCILLLAKLFLPTNASVKIESAFGRVYIMTCLSTLSLGATIYFLVPWIGLFAFIVPLYTAYITVNGVRCLRVPDNEAVPAATVMVSLILAVPVLIYILLEFLMPK